MGPFVCCSLSTTDNKSYTTTKAMFKNYLKSTLRNLRKKKGYTLIHLTGLTMGMVCFTIIMYWVLGELNYDRFHTKVDRIYRVTSSVQNSSDQYDQAVTSPPAALALKNDFPGIEAVTRIDKNDAIVRSEHAHFKEDDILLTDTGFFNIFDFRLLRGNPQTALEKPYSIVLSQKMAEKYFGNENVIGKTLTLYLYDPGNQGAEYTVTGIVQNAPENSHIQYNFLISFSTFEENFPEVATSGWSENFIYTYVLLNEEAESHAIESGMPDFLRKHMGEAMQQNMGTLNYHLQPIKEIYLHSDLRNELTAGGDYQYVLILISIGIFVLVLAGINYINLSTAFAIDRLEDAGIRKVNGATRIQLFGYYLYESIILIGGSFLITLLIFELFNPFLASMIGKDSIELLSSGVIGYLAIASLIIGLTSGIFPAALLASSDPLKGLGKSPLWMGKKSSLRKGLVIFQFSVTILLLVCIFAIHDQLNFIHNKDIGFDKDSLITLSVNGSNEVLQGYQSFKEELSSYSSISGVTRSNTSIGNGLDHASAIALDDNNKEIQATVYNAGIDYDFIPSYGIPLLAGRNYSPDFPTDSTRAFIINEAALKTFGWKDPEEAIGKPFQFMERKGQIIGVVKNFNFSSLYNPIQPVCLFLLDNGFSKMTIKASGRALAQSLSNAETVWKKHFPNSVFEYTFVDDLLARQYKTEQRMQQFFSAFSLISLFIACIGLYGLAGFSSKRRTKEIGIRKVLGASIQQIILMLNQQYFKLVLIAFFIGAVSAWYLMHEWLKNFAYRIDMSIWMFVEVGFITLLIVLGTVSWQSIKAAISNPVKSLRSE